MIDKRLVPYGGLKKEAFSGSHHGMRYLMNGDDGKNSTTFTVWVPFRKKGWIRRSPG